MFAEQNTSAAVGNYNNKVTIVTLVPTKFCLVSYGIVNCLQATKLWTWKTDNYNYREA